MEILSENFEKDGVGICEIFLYLRSSGNGLIMLPLYLLEKFKN